MIPTYLNPEIRVIRNHEGYGLSHYAGNIHVMSPGRTSGQVGPEDAPNTILAGEVGDGFKAWDTNRRPRRQNPEFFSRGRPARTGLTPGTCPIPYGRRTAVSSTDQTSVPTGTSPGSRSGTAIRLSSRIG